MTSLDLAKDWWGLRLSQAAIVFFLGTIVASIATIRSEIADVSKEMQRGLLLTRNVTRANTTRDVLDYVRRMGAFGTAIDSHFWFKYAEDLDTRGHATDVEKIDRLLRAIDESKVQVHKEAVYHLMTVLMKRVVRKEETYLATASISELRNAATDPYARDFFFKVPLDYPGKVTRVIYVDDKDELARMPDDVKHALRSQLDAKVNLRYSTEKKRLNFGVYGSLAVGVLDEKRNVNELIFDSQKVKEYRDRLTTMLNDPHMTTSLKPEDLDGAA